jgi:hypothetical protein
MLTIPFALQTQREFQSYLDTEVGLRKVLKKAP